MALITMLLSDGFDDPSDRADDAVKLRHFGSELLAAKGGELVVAGTAIPNGRAPFGGNPALDEHALQGRVEGAFFDLQDVVGDELDGIGDFVAVHLPRAGERFQDEE